MVDTPQWTREREKELLQRLNTSTSLMSTTFKRCSPKLREFVAFFVEPSGAVVEVMSEGGMPQSCLDEYRKIMIDVAAAGQLKLSNKVRYMAPAETLIDVIKLSLNRVVVVKDEMAERKTDPVHESMRFLHGYVERAIKEGASDVHFCARRSSSAVLIRVNGRTEKIDTLSYDAMHGPLAALYSSKHDPRSNSDESFSAMRDCSCTMTLKDLKCKLRWQTAARGQDDEYDVVCRIIPFGSTDKPKQLHEIGFLPSQVAELNMMTGKPDGLVIFSGVTGSGKSTTLQAMMGIARGDGSRKIYSLEDPIERIIFGVTQIQIQRQDVGSGVKDSSPFAAKIATLMRSDPDIIMVGEIRDAETANACIDGARTGHLIFSTLHSPNAIGIIGRLSSPSMGVEAETLATPGIMSCLIYQRLLPVLCPHCKRHITDSETHMKDQSLQYHLFSEDRFALDIGSVYVEGAGCEHCRQRRIVGQTICAEIIRPDDQMLEAVLRNNFVDATKQWRSTRQAKFTEDGFRGKTAMEIALYKVNQGIMDPYAVIDGFGDFGLHEILDI